jgi:hypothetical protein
MLVPLMGSVCTDFLILLNLVLVKSTTQSMLWAAIYIFVYFVIDLCSGLVPQSGPHLPLI